MPGTFAYTAATNTVLLTGGTEVSPADFASFVAADRAGVGTPLLAAWTPINNTKALTYQVRPVELLALLISFVVAGKTAETDYIFITGTDWLGNAQTETINVSAGNGTYVSVKYWRTITNIDCSDNAAGGGTVWTDGTVAVTQPIWGIIWNKGGNQYQCDCLFVVGNGTTATYFLTKGEQIAIHASIGAWLNCSNATFVSGELVSLTNKTTQNGSTFIFLRADGGTGQISASGGALVYLYSTHLIGNFSNTITAQLLSAIARMWNCIFVKDVTPQTVANVACDVHNITVQNSTFGFRTANASLTFLNFVATNCRYGLYVYLGGTAVFKNCILRSSTVANIRMYQITANKYFIDCDLDSWSFENAGGTHTALIYRQHTMNIHLTDILGVDIAGATVTLKDINGATVFSVTTDIDGKITEQTVTKGTYIPTSPFTFTDYGPHTLTISKDGYQDFESIITIDRKMDLEMSLCEPVNAASRALSINSRCAKEHVLQHR